ncbi:MAG: hypothetical protein PWQ83_780 [Thermosipho sp. (in: thermotogales)]|nr:hypothetical protein [Thermosipho sp. (in: thermotogales)]
MACLYSVNKEHLEEYKGYEYLSKSNHFINLM